MGSGASVTNGDRENREQYGDRVEVTKSVPVESFGRDNTTSANNRNGIGEKTLSSGSISEFRERSLSRTSKSRRSLGSFLKFDNKRDEVERGNNSDGNSCSAEAAEIKIVGLTRKNNDLQREKESMKRELENLRKNHAKWQNDCLKAREDEGQVKQRAKAFEDGK